MTTKVPGAIGRAKAAVLGPAAAALPVLRADALRGLRRRLREDQPAPFRLLDRAQQGHLHDLLTIRRDVLEATVWMPCATG